MGNLSLDQCVFTACLWEATARKAGNVHRYRDFTDLTYLDFIQSAHAIAPVIANMVDAPIGETVLECIKATRRVVSTNTNLGIVLLLVPLSKLEEFNPKHMAELLRQTTIRDAELVYEAIRLALPGGMGEVTEQDIKDVPTETLIEVMERAAERDTIAQLYSQSFMTLFSYMKHATEVCFQCCSTIEEAICTLQIRILALFPDSLIERKIGAKASAKVSRKAKDISDVTDAAASREAYREFDSYLSVRKSGLNPGTTADLVTASLFVALRMGIIDPSTPFTWAEYDA